MAITDIINETLTVGKIIAVIRNSNGMHHKLLTVNGRKSDAFVYIISGSCTYTVDGASFTANPGDVLYLAYKSSYTMYIHTEDYRFIYCDFEFVEPAERKCNHYRGVGGDAEALFLRLLRAYKSADVNKKCEMMSLIYRIYGALTFEANKRYVGATAKDKMRAARDYIDSHLSEQGLTVSALAEGANMSEAYFRRLFRSQYGVSPSRYIIEARLAHAKKLMEYPFLTVEDCAKASGFVTVQYFCRAFKKELGVTPARYRKK